MPHDLYWLPPAFFTVALLYATAGFGGGSSYLALLALTALPTADLRATALLCNLVVAGGGSLQLARAGKMPWRRALPLVLTSVPLAFLGGRVHLPREQFLLLLGVVLLVAALLMLLMKRNGVRREPGGSPLGPAALGGGLGFLAGVVGIGGGIFLSPVLFLRGWAAAKSIAAVTSLFIFANSLAGLAGQFSRSTTIGWRLTGVLLLAVLLGGQLGTRLTIEHLSPPTVRRMAALLILLVSLRLLYRYALAA